jgi:hypothetical protein
VVFPQQSATDKRSLEKYVRDCARDGKIVAMNDEINHRLLASLEIAAMKWVPAYLHSFATYNSEFGEFETQLKDPKTGRKKLALPVPGINKRYLEGNDPLSLVDYGRPRGVYCLRPSMFGWRVLRPRIPSEPSDRRVLPWKPSLPPKRKVEIAVPDDDDDDVPQSKKEENTTTTTTTTTTSKKKKKEKEEVIDLTSLRIH